MVGLEVVAFDVEPDSLCDYDYLTVNGVKYCGTSGPQGVVPEDGVIEWTSDDGVVRSGWKARTDGSLSPRLLTISTHVSNPFRSAGRHGRQPSQGVLDLPSPQAPGLVSINAIWGRMQPASSSEQPRKCLHNLGDGASLRVSADTSV